MAAWLAGVAEERGKPKSITVDNGSEFYSKAMDHWSYQNGVLLDFIRPGRQVENGYIESFNGRLRDECLNIHLFASLEDARDKLHLWREDCHDYRPHGSLANLPPAAFAAKTLRTLSKNKRKQENSGAFTCHGLKSLPVQTSEQRHPARQENRDR